MTDTPPPPLDPRFSPDFQRGFDPGADAAPPVTGRGALAPTPPAAASAGPRTAAASSIARTSAARTSSAPSSPYEISHVAQRVAPSPLPPVGGHPADAAFAPPLGYAGQPGSEQYDPGQFAAGQIATVELGAAAPATASLRNPFLIALGVVAIGLVALGGWLFARSSAAFNDPGNIASQGDYMSLQSMVNAAPIFILLGAATAIGVLFVFALRWRGSR